MATIRSDSKFFYFFKSNVVFILKSSSIKDYGKLETRKLCGIYSQILLHTLFAGKSFGFSAFKILINNYFKKPRGVYKLNDANCFP